MIYTRKWSTDAHPINVFVAKDGKKFNNKWDCLNYEMGNKIKTSFDDMKKRIQPLVFEFGDQTTDYDDIESFNMLLVTVNTQEEFDTIVAYFEVVHNNDLPKFKPYSNYVLYFATYYGEYGELYADRKLSELNDFYCNIGYTIGDALNKMDDVK